MKAHGMPALVVLAVAAACPAGEWISADAPDGKAAFPPVPLFWFRVVRNPVVYRKLVDVPQGADRATALLRTSGYVYVCVDGEQLYAWGAPKDSAERPRIPGEAERIHEIDLSERLTPGRHVLTVSAPAGAKDAGGFVLDGGLYEGTRRVTALTSDASWTATIFRPTEILEDHAIQTAAYDGSAGKDVCTAARPVKVVGGKWTAAEDALAAAHFRALLKRLNRELDDAAWRSELLVKKGIYVVDGFACGWGGPLRRELQQSGAVARAGMAYAAVPNARAGLRKLSERTVNGVKQLDSLAGDIRGNAERIAAISSAAREGARLAREADEAKAMELAARHTKAAPVSPATGEVLRKALESAVGHPLNRLNESRYDRLGYLPHPQLADSDLGKWGVRVNPVTGPTTVGLPHRWRFSTDPQDAGLKELRHTIGYNIETQWPWIDGQQSWTGDKRFRDYKGVAWYRNRVHVPAEWAGNDVVLRMRIAGSARAWINDQEITKRRAADGLSFVVPARAAMFGSDNLLAVRVVADGAARGLVGSSEVSCPALEGPQGKQTPPVGVLATPLSPCVALWPQGPRLEVHHAGKGELLLPGGSAKTTYSAAADGRLQANWVLLWLTPRDKAAAERPILLVFRDSPMSISCAEGLTTILLPRPPEMRPGTGRPPGLLAVRPWTRAVPRKDDPDVLAKAAFWSRAALAVPVNYMSVTRVLRKGEPWENASIDRVPAGPVLEQTVFYDYLQTKDQWGTKPLRIAPLPALCSLAMDAKFRGLRIDDAEKVRVLQDGGLAAPYRGVADTDRVSYSYPIEPWPRLVGFTSWMFAGSDTGVPGNDREMEIIAATGANSYRPQNNFCQERSPHYKEDPRTRIQIMADFCRAVGVNFMNNIDQTLGANRQEVRADYDGWVKRRLLPHYDKLVPQLKDRPFWEVAYDLINEPFDHQAAAYNRVTKELTARIRKLDRRHLCYIEPCQAWGAIQQLRLVEPTGDELTMYSFHDYNFRMQKSEDRWPTLDRDITSICRMWWPAFEFAIRHGVGMHCGEYGGFHAPTDDLLCQKTLLNDFLRIFDQFGMHHHYYTGRGIYQRQLDGSLRPSNVVRAFREYSKRQDLNFYYKRWPGQPPPGGRR